ncbi:MAG TPA: septal ring lytic transglycosylase RlpA family protein [Zoogloea sp.]|nr:septal ring lytic transglycosylase RlpA family protein [Zoogloea sp.]
MQPVAKHPRAGFRPEALCRVLSRLLVVVGCAASACAAAADAQDSTEPVFQSSLKPGSPKQIFSGAFRYESPDDGADEASVPLEAPHFEKGDYALGQGVALGNSGSSFRQKGVASWYGKPFHGRKTSSGDSFDMYAMTAAHPSLPIPSYVRVTNLANGRSAVVRINDRGPFHPGRIIDLSYAAAYKLGYVDNGHASVEVALMLPEGVAMVSPARKVPPIRRAPPAQVAAAIARPAPSAVVAETSPVSEAPQAVTAASAPPAVPAPVAAASVAPAGRGSEPVFLQLGAFASSVNAEHFKGFVEHELQWLRSSVSVLASEGKYRLQLGPFTSALEARAIAERIASTLKLRPVVKSRD